MKFSILVMGLPGAGKTTLARALVDFLASVGKTVEWYNADNVRTKYNDWDFSHEGRIRQSLRMKDLVAAAESEYVVCDFVAPLQEMRKTLAADYIIWLDTIKHSEYEDTDQIFVPPSKYNYYVADKDAERYATEIGEHLLFLSQHSK
jgi:adenylylsulfate kinase